jgi:hypothetical protein
MEADLTVKASHGFPVGVTIDSLQTGCALINYTNINYNELSMKGNKKVLDQLNDLLSLDACNIALFL